MYWVCILCPDTETQPWAKQSELLTSLSLYPRDRPGTSSKSFYVIFATSLWSIAIVYHYYFLFDQWNSWAHKRLKMILRVTATFRPGTWMRLYLAPVFTLIHFECRPDMIYLKQKSSWKPILCTMNICQKEGHAIFALMPLSSLLHNEDPALNSDQRSRRGELSLAWVVVLPTCWCQREEVCFGVLS